MTCRCGNTIPPERLKAIPCAIRCTPCQTLHERQVVRTIPLRVIAALAECGEFKPDEVWA